MPAGNEDLKANDAIYFKIGDSALGATWRVGKKDSVKIGKVRPLKMAVQSPSPHHTLADTFHSPHSISAPKLAVVIPSTHNKMAVPSPSPRSTSNSISPKLPVMRTELHSTGPQGTGGRLWRGL